MSTVGQFIVSIPRGCLVAGMPRGCLVAGMPRGCHADAARMSRGCSADFAPITDLVDVGHLATAYVTYLTRAVCVLCRPKISCARCILGSQNSINTRYIARFALFGSWQRRVRWSPAAAGVAGCGLFHRLQVGGIRTWVEILESSR